MKKLLAFILALGVVIGSEAATTAQLKAELRVELTRLFASQQARKKP